MPLVSAVDFASHLACLSLPFVARSPFRGRRASSSGWWPAPSRRPSTTSRRRMRSQLRYARGACSKRARRLQRALLQPPPRPFKYAYAAGRSPNGQPDRYVEQEGDEQGVVKGSYAYLDPNWKWRKVRLAIASSWSAH